MATWLKQSTAVEIKLGPFVDSTDGFTAETGLTISQADARLAKNGGDWAQKNESTTLVHEENGWYRCLLDTTDTGTLGILMVAVNESGALPVWREFLVIAANVYDSIVGGGDLLDVNTQEWNDLATVALPLVPTTAGRTLDVTAGGNAGIDWANVEAPTTALDLSGTNIKTDQKVDVNTIKTNPVVNGGTVTFPTNATLASTTNITAGTITTVTTLTNLPAITASWLTAAGIASDAFTAAKFAADVSAEIADAVWDEDATGHQTQGTFGQAVGDPVANTNSIYKAVVTDASGATVGADTTAIFNSTAAIESDTGVIAIDVDDIQARLPAALTANGNMKSDMLRIQGTLQTAGDVVAKATDIQDRLPAALINDAYMACSVEAIQGDAQSATDLKDFTDDGYDPATHKVQGVVLVDTVTALAANSVNSSALAATAVTEIVDGVWDAVLADHQDAGSTGEALGDAGSAGDPWNTALPGAYGAGTAGKIVGDNLNATVSSRATQVSVDDLPTNAELATALADYGADQPTESYAVAGAVPTRDQFLFMVYGLLANFVYSGTTQSVKKVDGTTEAMTFELDSDTTPTEHLRT